MRIKKAAIIGGLELIGSYIVLKFLAEGYAVKVQVSRKNKFKNDPFFRNIGSNRNLKVCILDLENPAELQKFVEDCEVIIFCGHPLKLDLETEDKSVYVPVIKGTRSLLNAIKTSDVVQKVIFITSAAAINTGIKAINPGSSKGSDNTKNLLTERAQFHAGKAEQKIIDSFPESFFKIIYLPPFGVNNLLLTTSTDSTSLGLRSVFSTIISPDTCFQKLVKKQLLERIENIDELPDTVFNAATRNVLNAR